MYRWFSGKYDTVKQKQVSIEHDINRSPTRDDMFRMYTASLRLEMLFYGMVVVTDSQWYDGRYFARLSEHDEDFFYFKKLTINYGTPLFQIRRDINFFNRIFAKAFEFSSLPDDDPRSTSLVSSVKEFGARNSNEIELLGGSFPKYFELLRDSIDNQFRPKIDVFEEHISHLNIIPPTLLSNWSVDRTKPSMVWRVFNGTLKDPPHEAVIAYIEKTYLNHWSDDTTGGIKIGLDINSQKIKAQILSLAPNRTLIKGLVDDSNSKNKNSIYDELFDYITFLFNTAFALQHECDLCDVADISVLLASDKEVNIKTMDLPIEFYYCISNLSWREFEYFMNIPKIKQHRKSWLKLYKLSQLTNSSTDRKRAFDELNKLILYIQTLVGKTEVEPYQDEFSFNVETGNILVGGGSSLKETSDNESCYLLVIPGVDEIMRCRFSESQEAADFHLGTIGAKSNSIVIAKNI